MTKYTSRPGTYVYEFRSRNSALYLESAKTPRNLPCPTCGTPKMLTPADVRRGYQCASCADSEEGWGP